MRLQVLYIEEQTSVVSEYLLPLLSEKVGIYLVTGNNMRIPKANYARLVLFPPPCFDLQRSWTVSRLASRILREYPIDVVHSMMSIDWLLPTSVPVIAHNGGSWYAVWRIAARQRPFWRRYRLVSGFLHYVVPEFISLRRARHILAVSESLRQELNYLYGLPYDKITVAYNAVPSFLREFAKTKSKEDTPHLVYTGRLHWAKGIVGFLEAFVRSPQLNVRFTIIGDGPDRPAVERLISQDGRVRLLGRLSREHLYQELSRTNIFINPSFYEGFSLSLLEAMATGHACVIRNIPTLVEALGEDNGLVCNSVEEMVHSIEALIRDPDIRFDFQMRAVQRSRSFTWEDTASQILDVYSKVTQKRC